MTVTLVDSNGVTAALLSNDLGHFDDNSDEGPYALTILNPSQEALLQSGRIRLRIDPNGHDTWRFNFFLEMIFSDGSRLSGGANSLELTQNRKQQEFGIDGIVQRVNWCNKLDNFTKEQPEHYGGGTYCSSAKFCFACTGINLLLGLYQPLAHSHVHCSHLQSASWPWFSRWVFPELLRKCEEVLLILLKHSVCKVCRISSYILDVTCFQKCYYTNMGTYSYCV